jgi:hypothetical protein
MMLGTLALAAVSYGVATAGPVVAVLVLLGLAAVAAEATIIARKQ